MSSFLTYRIHLFSQMKAFAGTTSACLTLFPSTRRSYLQGLLASPRSALDCTTVTFTRQTSVTETEKSPSIFLSGSIISLVGEHVGKPSLASHHYDVFRNVPLNEISFLGGNHFRAWKQNGTEVNTGAWFLGCVGCVMYVFTQSHSISRVSKEQVRSTPNGCHYLTELTSGLLKPPYDCP